MEFNLWEALVTRILACVPVASPWWTIVSRCLFASKLGYGSFHVAPFHRSGHCHIMVSTFCLPLQATGVIMAPWPSLVPQSGGLPSPIGFLCPVYIFANGPSIKHFLVNPSVGPMCIAWAWTGLSASAGFFTPVSPYFPHFFCPFQANGEFFVNCLKWGYNGRESRKDLRDLLVSISKNLN